MGLVFPSEAVARRWNGALQARLRRAPLEAFLRARSLSPAPRGVAQDSDDVARATVLIVEAGLSFYLAGRPEGLAFRQRAGVGYLACLISRALAQSILQPEAWRIAALVSAARLLSPWIGLNAAAMASSSSVRQFQTGIMKPSSSLESQIIEQACSAVDRNDDESMAAVAASIAALLDMAASQGCDRDAEGLRELHAGP